MVLFFGPVFSVALLPPPGKFSRKTKVNHGKIQQTSHYIFKPRAVTTCFHLKGSSSGDFKKPAKIYIHTTKLMTVYPYYTTPKSTRDARTRYSSQKNKTHDQHSIGQLQQLKAFIQITYNYHGCSRYHSYAGIQRKSDTAYTTYVFTVEKSICFKSARWNHPERKFG